MTHRSVISLSLLSLVFLLGCSNVTRPLAAINPLNPPPVLAAPQSVWHSQFKDQIGPLPTTVVVPTLAADGDFLVSVYVTAQETATPVPQAVGVYPLWQDENGAVDPLTPPFTVSGSIPGIGNGPMRLEMTKTIHAVKGSNISVTGLVGGDSTNKYDLFVTVQVLE